MELNQEAQGPGAQLKNARERLGMSIENVSQSLKLSKRIILAVESDDYSNEKILSTAFIRGYLRSYARLVNISEEKIIQDFDNLGFFSRKESFLSPNVASVGDFDSSAKYSYRFLILLFLLGGALGLGWFYYQDKESFSRVIAEQILPVFSSQSKEIKMAQE